MVEIGLGVAAFTGIVLCLVLAVLAVRSRLVPSGEVSIEVNGVRTVPGRPGDKLLGALTEAGIHLPSACGGVGTCGQCSVRVLRGGGPPLPTEAGRFTRRETAEGARLACQVAIREDMAVTVPDEVIGANEWSCTVRSNRNVASLMKELILELPAGERIDFRAGSYVVVACPPYRARFTDFDVGTPYRDEWDRLDLWRFEGVAAAPTTRAYSLANYPDESDIIMLVVRIAIPPPGAPATVPPGVVSSYLFSLKPGDTVRVTGPFGNFFASEGPGEMVFVGGGAGMAPMRSHIFNQLRRLKTGRKISFWYGARNRRELFYAEEFDALQAEYPNFRWTAALSEPRPEDGWQGETGFIHQVLHDRYLAEHPEPEEIEYYLCGPPMMVRAVCNMLDRLGVDPENIFYDDFGS